MKEMNFFLRRSWNCVAISGTSMYWWIDHARVWLRHRGECKIALSVSQTSGAESRTRMRNKLLVQIIRSLSEKGRVFFKKKKILVLTSIVSCYLFWVRICRKIGHNFRSSMNGSKVDQYECQCERLRRCQVILKIPIYQYVSDKWS